MARMSKEGMILNTLKKHGDRKIGDVKRDLIYAVSPKQVDEAINSLVLLGLIFRPKQGVIALRETKDESPIQD